MGTTEPRDHREPLTRERVLRAGVQLADARGLERLSMRTLGRALGVEAMSLYNHVENKDDLLDGMVDLVIAEVEAPPADTPWKTAMRRRAVSSRAAFARHPWAVRLVGTRASAGPARLQHFENTIGSLRRAGFAPGTAVHALSTLDGFVHGFGVHRLHVAEAGAAEDDLPDDAAMAVALARWLPAGEYPYLNELIRDHVIPGGYDEDASFAFGLDLILDGLEARLADEA